MASESIFSNSVGAFPNAAKPQLIVVHDINDYPATARCSACGEEMPVRQSWINSASDNMAWFTDQFRLHVE
jgi:hypothetical protein